LSPRPPENVELVQRTYRLIEELRAGVSGALDDAFRDYVAADFEIHLPADYPEGVQVFRGREGLRDWIATTKEIWGEWRFERERFIDAGDQVVVLVRVVARGGSSGVPLDRKTAHIWTVRGARVTRCKVYLDRSEALEVVGLRS
jgi:ketosteroid isomerase-like protein